MTALTPERRAAVDAPLVERRTHLYAQARFTASARRAAWTLIRTRKASSP